MPKRAGDDIHKELEREQKRMTSQISLLVYPGSKRRNIPELLPLLPKPPCTIISTFFGGGSFEFYLARHGYNVIACDVFPALFNFWNHVQLHPAELATCVSECFYPMDPELFKCIRDHLMSIREPSSVQHAAMFFVVSRCSFNGNNESVSRKKLDAFNKRNGYAHKIRQFVWPKNLTLLHMDYRELLNQHPNDFVYADPPYKLNVCSMYGFKGEHHKHFDQKEFAIQMKSRKSDWIVTYNDDLEMRDYFKGHSIQFIKDSIGFKRKSKKKDHIVISPPTEIDGLEVSPDSIHATMAAISQSVSPVKVMRC